MSTPAERAVDAINAVYGRHDGHRALHAKGTVCSGRFTATAAAAELTRAPHMQGQTLDATVRFSNGSGDPRSLDWRRDVRGLGVKIHLPDGSRTDIVAVTLRCFWVRTRDDFIAFTRAQRKASIPGLRQLRQLWWVVRNRRSWYALRGYLALKPILSYANCRYNALHAYRLVDRDGTARAVRYSWAPEAGEAQLGSREAKRRGPDYLQEELVERFGREPPEPIVFRLELQLAGEGDPEDDPTVAWPRRGDPVVAGRLEVTGLETGRETGDGVLVFDPTRVPDGIELTDDAILRFRPPAYAISAKRRTGGDRVGE